MSDLSAAGPVEAVAIVGMAGRFPRARNLDEFWERLAAGEELVSFFGEDELLAAGLPAALVRDPSFVKARAVLEDAELFDAAFFGINPREAEIMDPQQRLFLECAWEALEHAGYDPDRYAGAIGVYAGLSMNPYLYNNLFQNLDVANAAGAYQLMLANDKDFIATRVAYKLNLRGPAVNVQTACSTSLVAVQMACQSLLSYQCDMALAGGVSVGSPRKSGHLYQPGMIMSPDGHCRTFDAKAQGIVAGEGVGLVVLKRLSEALADGDTIHAVILGAAINNDGAQKVGFTAPSVDGQAEVIAMAQAMAGIGPETIGYVEAHGTGTELGDPIEVVALTQAFRAGTAARGYCALGSVKSNMGHLDAAAGIAGLLKTVLALKQRRIPPSLHFEEANPNIDFAASPFYVNTTLRDWAANGTPRRAGVSSFGIGGTNAHVVLEEAPTRPVARSRRPSHLLLLSARTASALENATDALADHLRAHPALDLGDVAYTLQNGRKPLGERRIAVVGGDPAEAAAILERREPRRVVDAAPGAQSRAVAFLFSGQGAQYVNMARELYEVEPVFRAEVDRCAEALKPHLGLDLRAVLYPEPAAEADAARQLVQTALAQPALFVVEYALAQLWMAWGVRPQAMLGHSIGEYVAACLAGVLSLEDALALVAARGRLMQDLPPGSMLAVPLAAAEIEPELGPDLALAAVNAPRLCVVSGPTPQVEALRERLEARGVSCRPLHTSHAFHSPMMEPVLKPFAEQVARLRLQPPSLPYLSNVTGTWITPEQATDPAYWAAHLRSTVRFADAAAELFRDPSLIFLEVGPGQTLSTLMKQHPDRPEGCVALASLRHPHDPTPDHQFLLTTLGRLWLAGTEIDWSGLYAGEARQRVPLPTYPFEGERYWVEPQTAAPVAAPTRAPAKRLAPADWFYVPSWKRMPTNGAAGASTTAAGQNWLFFTDALGLGGSCARRLAQLGHHVVRVSKGTEFNCVGDASYTVNPRAPEDYDALFARLRATGEVPDVIVHLWAVSAAERSAAAQSVEADLALGFYSLLSVAQSVGRHGLHNPIRVEVVSSNVHDVNGTEPLQVAKATLLGLCRVLPQEHMNVLCRNIDLAVPDARDDGQEELVDQLLDELSTPLSHPVVAYRGRQRWVQTYEPLPFGPAPHDALPLKQGGVYLITGGLGNIGLTLAEYLAETCQARLALVGRSPFPEAGRWAEWLAAHDEQDPVSRQIRRLQRLEALGAAVLVAAADVASEDQLRAVVAQVDEHFGGLDGVIHAAGVLAPQTFLPISELGAGECEQQFRPKVYGLLALDRVLQGRALDLRILMSSLSTVLGGLGYTAYAAANAFMDAFAQLRDRSPQSAWTCVNWDGWQTAELPDTAAAGRGVVEFALTPQEGTDAFARILASRKPPSQIVVSTGDLQARIAQWSRLEPLLNEGLPEPAGAVVMHSRPALEPSYMGPRNDVEEHIVSTWETLLGINPIGIHDSFFDLGGHSLLATQLVTRLQRLFGVQLPLRMIFEAQTVAEQAERIETMLWAAETRSAEPVLAQGERDEIEL